jgi:hypothetical protein
LLWESSDGEPTTRNLLFVRRGPAEPQKDARGRKRYETDDRNGFHALRHYFASAVLQKGMPLTTLAEILGHSSITTTSKYYAHLMPDAFDYARETANAELASFEIFFSDGTATEQEAAWRRQRRHQIVAGGTTNTRRPPLNWP